VLEAHGPPLIFDDSRDSGLPASNASCCFVNVFVVVFHAATTSVSDCRCANNHHEDAQTHEGLVERYPTFAIVTRAGLRMVLRRCCPSCRRPKWKARLEVQPGPELVGDRRIDN
jgi:hypothetical protein